MSKLPEIQKLLEKNYESGITLITPTGDRNVCWSKCNFYITNQTYKGSLQWIIADDGNEKLDLSNLKIDYTHTTANYPGNKAKSINHNICRALQYVKYDKIAIIEDDDIYHPKYLERLLERLDHYDLIGEGNSRYYNINGYYRINHNTKHASLFQTGLKTIPCIEHLYVSTLREQSAFIDSRLWNKKVKKFVFCDDVTAIGMKGLPGRKGIGIGHRPSSAFNKDKDFKVLKQWLKNYPEDYIDFYINLRQIACKS